MRPSASKHGSKILRWNLLFFMVICIGLLSGCTARVHTNTQNVPENTPTAPKAELIEAKPEWFSCRQQSDCQVEEGLCGAYSAVNKNYLEPFQTFRDKMTPTLDCRPQSQATNQPTAQCVQNRCALDEGLNP